MADFTSVLDRNFDDIEKPKPVPVGTYFGQIVGVPKDRQIDVKGEKQTVVDFNIKLTGAKVLDDPTALDTYDLAGARPVQRTFFIDSDEGLFGMKQFLANTLGIVGSGRKMKEIMSEAVGKQLLVTVGHRPYQDKQTGQMELATDVKGTAPV